MRLKRALSFCLGLFFLISLELSCCLQLLSSSSSSSSSSLLFGICCWSAEEEEEEDEVSNEEEEGEGVAMRLSPFLGVLSFNGFNI